MRPNLPKHFLGHFLGATIFVDPDKPNTGQLSPFCDTKVVDRYLVLIGTSFV